MQLSHARMHLSGDLYATWLAGRGVGTAQDNKPGGLQEIGVPLLKVQSVPVCHCIHGNICRPEVLELKKWLLCG